MAFRDLVARADRAAVDHLGGDAVVYRPAIGNGDPVTVTGMFDANYLLVERDETGVEQRGPAVFLRLEDLPTHPDEDDPTLTILGADYDVRERRPDGLGGILLLLHLVE